MSVLNIFPLVLLPFSPTSIENRQATLKQEAEQTYMQTEVFCTKPGNGAVTPEREVFRFSVRDIKSTMEENFAQVAHSKNFKVVPQFIANQYSIIIHSGDYSFEVPVPRGVGNETVRLASLSHRNAPINLSCFATLPST